MTDDRIIYDIRSIPASLRGGVLTIGNFDGVHRGHQRILRACRVAADARRVPVVAMTFDPLPEAVLFPHEEPPPLIVPPTERYRRLLAHGTDAVIVLPVTPDLLALPAREFVDELLVKPLAPTRVVEGANFFFGRRRGGNIVTLETMGFSRGFSVDVVDSAAVTLGQGQRRISSTLIRELIRDGRVEDAAACLDGPVTLIGQVVPGQRRGRLMGFPTINLQPTAPSSPSATSWQGQVIPGDGVYAGHAHIAGRRHLAAVSVGPNPTFAPAARTVEAYLLDTQGDFYGLEVELTFRHRLRDQQRFDSAETLTSQIQRDIEAIRRWLGDE
ncbi:MAG: riboflavin biosynthesis protein RibF [Phycisphaerae bacterium]|nr:riboflavin biosynthesis protein RibF [Phycisphaerae bacterium]